MSQFPAATLRVCALLVCLLTLACARAQTIEKSSIPPLKIVDVTLAKDVKAMGTTSMPVSPGDTFFSADEKVASHVIFAHLSGTHLLRWEWYAPDGKLFLTSGDYLVEARPGAYVKEGAACHELLLNRSAAAKTGEWKVKFYLDDTLAELEKFTLLPSPMNDDISGIDFGRYHALVIGNDNYADLPKLNSAVNDAEAVAGILEKEYGFEVTLKRDATRADIVLALDDLRRRLTYGDNLLIYYAGHGSLDADADEGYWLPVDAARENSLNWISSSQITADLKAMDAKHVLIVADSCYAGKLTRDSRAVGVKKLHGYYEKIVKKRARSVLCSGGLEPVIDDGGLDGHSIFASAFIEALESNKRVIDGTAIFSQLRRPVMLNADQTPEYSDIRKAGHDGGDFIFVRNELLERK